MSFLVCREVDSQIFAMLFGIRSNKVVLVVMFVVVAILLRPSASDSSDQHHQIHRWISHAF